MCCFLIFVLLIHIGSESRVSTTQALGSRLRIHLHKPLEIGDEIKLVTEFSTSPESSALQWLQPAQTAGKKMPYLFSQAQAIHARSFVPCQVPYNFLETVSFYKHAVLDDMYVCMYRTLLPASHGVLLLWTIASANMICAYWSEHRNFLMRDAITKGYQQQCWIHSSEVSSKMLCKGKSGRAMTFGVKMN